MAVPTQYLVAQPATSRDEMEALASSLGVELRTQDAPAKLVEYYASVASSRVLFFVGNAATTDVLIASPFVRAAASALAAYLLTTHGGEPGNPYLKANWEAWEEMLKLILSGEARVPDLVIPAGKRYGGGIVAVNVRVDPQRIPAVRRVGPGSMDTPAGYPVPFDWATQFYPRW